MKALTIGGAMRDMFVHYPCTDILRMQTVTEEHTFIILEEGKKIKINELEYHVGGGAANSAASFARLGFTTSCFFKIGTDSFAQAIITKMKQEQVNTTHIVQTADAPTGTSIILPCPSGNRTVLIYRGANLTVTKDDVPEKILSEHDVLYVSSLSENASLIVPMVTSMAKKAGVLVASNPGTSQLTARIDTLIEALPYIDIVIMNNHEAHLLMNALIEPTVKIHQQSLKNEDLPLLLRTANIGKDCFSLQQFFTAIHTYGPTIIVVTNGAEGVYVSDTKSMYFHPSIVTNIVSTLGAGDAFGSCFVAHIARKKSIPEAIRAGVINSSSVLEHMDTQTGLLTQAQLDEELKNIDQNLLKTYIL